MTSASDFEVRSSQVLGFKLALGRSNMLSHKKLQGWGMFIPQKQTFFCEQQHPLNS